ncbi:ferredoxin [Gordonia sp. ABSL1-1]|uniref:ferredoxin n=1 Tax=Gordonia sp. ABSL1-1 TaxID=3053923 RepID=UPI00257296F3|nr:ferredoxin [Gordonia sp. ABSL1-1]MDL9938076.1 ferredoxin [Gordonia sp. ABSL1-1]
MEVHIDLEKCAGHARCYAVSEELFDLDDSGYALHADIAIPPGQEDKAREAVASCPERAIHIR